MRECVCCLHLSSMCNHQFAYGMLQIGYVFARQLLEKICVWALPMKCHVRNLIRQVFGENFPHYICIHITDYEPFV